MPVTPTAPDAAQDAAGDLSGTDTRSELRDWIKDNATLLSNASLLISLAAVALSLLPDVGIFAPYIKALIFAAAFLLLTELHHQWPEDLQLHMLRKNARPDNHSWRMTAFAFVMQIATILFAAWAILTNPIILLPLTALAVVLAFRQWYFRRYGGLLARSFGIIALVAVLLLSEVLMVDCLGSRHRRAGHRGVLDRGPSGVANRVLTLRLPQGAFLAALTLYRD